MEKIGFKSRMERGVDCWMTILVRVKMMGMIVRDGRCLTALNEY